MSLEYKIQTEVFVGPIELLLYLARKNEIDIFDVSLKKITDDYVAYLKQVKELNLEISADFLLMAIVLLRLKMWRLLPSTQCDEEVPETKISLDEIISEYKKYASVAGLLSDLEQKRLQLFHRRSPIFEEFPNAKGDIYLLFSAFQRIFEKKLSPPILQINVPEIKLEDKIRYLRNILLQETRISFFDITKRSQSLSEIIIIFIALLELIRLGEIKIWQEGEFSEIIIEKKLVSLDA